MLLLPKPSAANLRHRESSHKTFAGGTVETFVAERRKIFQYIGLFLFLGFGAVPEVSNESPRSKNSTLIHARSLPSRLNPVVLM